MGNKNIEVYNDEPNEKDSEFTRIIITGYKIHKILSYIKIKINKEKKNYTIEGYLDNKVLFKIYSKVTDKKQNNIEKLFQFNYYWFKLEDHKEVAFRLVEIHNFIEEIHRHVKKEPINLTN